jgi:ATP-dependent DNA helicase RecG
MTVDLVNKLIEGKEDEHCEFKEAKNSFNFDDLCRYCVGLANERGGKLILGVTNKRPRKVVGTAAYHNVEDTAHRLLQSVKMRVEIEPVAHPDGRVLIFHIPPRPVGYPLHYEGAYLMRSGESLVPMSSDQLRRIYNEARGIDFSAEICPDATVNDLDPAALAVFRDRWHKKTGNSTILEMSDEQLLEDSELTVDGKITYAGLILLGTRKALGRYLAQAEVILEYRSAEGQIASSQRFEFRQGFLAMHDELWNQINVRNDVTSVRDGLFRRDIPAFNEDAVREAVLNAVCHRDYQLGGSVFVRQYPRRLQISSPGGLPDGITPENILQKQSPRNRRLAEACAKCGLVERSGQGMDRIFDASLREGKGLPDFTGTGEHEVVLTMRGEVIDDRFLQLLDLAEKYNISLNVYHLVVLDMIRQSEAPPPEARHLVDHLIAIGLLERVGKGRQRHLVLSRGMYRYLGEPGTYTRYAGLDRETNKELILKHIRDSGGRGAALSEFRQVLPQLTEPQVRHMVYELRDEGKVRLVGWSGSARWHLAIDVKEE